jgi:nucleoside triphosphate pyrophosphatase
MLEAILPDPGSRATMPLYDSITLASASPRRRELLRQIGIAHTVQPAGIDESRGAGEAPTDYVRRLARAKAEAVWREQPETVVLAADTAVVLGGELFGKPGDLKEGLRLLGALSGRTHEVLTAVAVRHPAGGDARVSVSEVSFRALSPSECLRYWETGEPLGKAGGYAIQGLAATFVVRLAGSYSGVMGLPLAETAALLAAAGVRMWNTAAAA